VADTDRAAIGPVCRRSPLASHGQFEQRVHSICLPTSRFVSNGQTIFTSAPESWEEILIEARWREQKIEWVAIGIGINVARPADVPSAAGLEPGTRRIDVSHGCLLPVSGMRQPAPRADDARGA
jgi:hypothetical protein